MKTREEQIEAIQRALTAANGCLIEAGQVPLTSEQIQSIAEPLLDDLQDAEFLSN